MDSITSTRIKKALLFMETLKAWVYLIKFSQTSDSTNPHIAQRFGL